MEAREWYSPDQAAEYLGVSKRTVYRLCKEGRLTPYVLGAERTRRFRRKDLDEVPRPMAVARRHEQEVLSSLTHPLLAALWDNEKDAEYDDL